MSRNGTPSRTGRGPLTPRTSTPSKTRTWSPTATSRAKPSAGSEAEKRVENVTVAVRVRSFLESEKRDLAVRMKENECEVHVQNRGRFPFRFDRCFWSTGIDDPEKLNASQEDVFNCIGLPLVDNMFQGYNSSIVAYGPTGSGKTYSVFGPPNSLGTRDEGLVPRVCSAIFERCAKKDSQSGTSYRVDVSIFEVYLEEVYDLLNQRRHLGIRGDGQGHFSVCGLKTFEVHNAAEVLDLLQKADELRTFAVTAIHDRSSRAHTLFQLRLRALSESGTSITSRVLIADLAGSERVKIAKTDTGLPLEQACNINLSLLNLGTCVEAVVNRLRNNQPLTNIGEFRNSALTKVLKDFLAGNCLTALLATVSPAQTEVHHTLQALRFADRAKQLACQATINTNVEADVDGHEKDIEEVLAKKRSLLDKEYGLELLTRKLAERQTEMESQAMRLEAEKRSLQAAADVQQSLTKEELNRMHAKEAEVERMLEQLQNELARAKKERDELDDKLLEVYTENAVVAHDHDEMTKNVAQLMMTIEQMKQDHEDELMLNRVEQEAAAAEQKKRITEMRNERESNVRHYETLIEELKHTHQKTEFHLKEEAAAAATRCEKEYKEKLSAQTELATTRKQLISLEEDLAEYRQNLTAERWKNGELLQSMSSAKTHEAQLVAELKALQQIGTLDTHEKDELRRQLHEMTKKFSELGQLAEGMSRANNEMKEESATLKKTIQDKCTIIEDTERAIREKGAACDAQSKEIESLKKLNQQLKFQVEENAAEAAVLKRRLGEAHQDAERREQKLQDTIKGAESNLEELRRVNIDLTCRLKNESTLQVDFKKNSNEAIVQLRTQIEHLEAEKASHRRNFDETLEAMKRTHKSEITALKSQYEDHVEDLRMQHMQRTRQLQNDASLYLQQIFVAQQALSVVTSTIESRTPVSPTFSERSGVSPGNENLRGMTPQMTPRQNCFLGSPHHFDATDLPPLDISGEKEALARSPQSPRVG